MNTNAMIDGIIERLEKAEQELAASQLRCKELEQELVRLKREYGEDMLSLPWERLGPTKR